MDVVQVTRRVVEQQVRPGQRGAATVAAMGAQEVAGRPGKTRFLMKVGADGVVREYGVYGRGRYGRRRYLSG